MQQMTPYGVGESTQGYVQSICILHAPTALFHLRISEGSGNKGRDYVVGSYAGSFFKLQFLVKCRFLPPYFLLFLLSERSSILEALSDHRYFQIESSASSGTSLEAIARTTTATTMMMKLTFGVVGGQVVAPGHSYRATLESFPRKEMIAATWATHLDAENDAVHFLPDSCRPPSSIPIAEGAAGTFVFLFSNFKISS